MRKFTAAALLILRFLWAVLVSGLQTVRVILQHGFRREGSLQSAFIRLHFTPMTETGAVFLGCMISLTPGTTTIEIDMERFEMLLHVLDASAIDAIVSGIRRNFERGLVVLFGVPR